MSFLKYFFKKEEKEKMGKVFHNNKKGEKR